jgi:hypothetical protein
MAFDMNPYDDDPHGECRHEIGMLMVELKRTRDVLIEVRKWIGDGEYSDGLHRDHWTPAYREVIDVVDKVIWKGI